MYNKTDHSGKLSEIFLRISPGRFHTIKFIIEGYDNLAILSSVDRKKGLVRLRFPREVMPEVFSLLTAIAAQLRTPCTME